MRLTILLLLVSVCSFGNEKSPLDFKITGAFHYLYHAKSKDMVNIQEEIWKDVVGYEGLYQISNQGRLLSLPNLKSAGKPWARKAKFLKPSFDQDGYITFGLSKLNVTKTHRAHRLVANHFIPNPENKPHVNHKKGIKTDNRASELDWMTNTENQRHAFDTGLSSIDHLVKYHTGRFRSAHKSAKTVYQYTLDGSYVNTYPCVLDACDAVNNNNVRHAATGRQKTCGGFKWSYTKLYNHG